MVAASKPEKLIPKKRNVFEYVLANGEDTFYEPEPPTEATECRAGSKGKIEIMLQRLKNGEDLHHADDDRTSATVAEQEEALAWIKDQMVLSNRSATEAARIRKRREYNERIEQSGDYLDLESMCKILGMCRTSAWRRMRHCTIDPVYANRRKWYLKSEVLTRQANGTLLRDHLRR